MFPLGSCACARLGHDILITIDGGRVLILHWQRLATRVFPEQPPGRYIAVLAAIAEVCDTGFRD
jgi:hypothetical protein